MQPSDHNEQTPTAIAIGRKTMTEPKWYSRIMGRVSEMHAHGWPYPKSRRQMAEITIINRDRETRPDGSFAYNVRLVQDNVEMKFPREKNCNL